MTQLPPLWVTDDVVGEVVHRLVSQPVAGIDSEFDSVDLRWQSPVCAARLDVLSVAIPVGDTTAAGFHECASFVIPRELLLGHRDLKAWLEDPRYLKVAHNLPMEAHALGNMGITLANGLNTLSMARFAYPERDNLPRGNYDLDSLCRDRFGRAKTEDFDELFGYDYHETLDVEENRKWCLTCGTDGLTGLSCRKKIGHPKETRTVLVPRQFKRRGIIPLSDVRPGHALFSRYLVYAAVDAVLAFQLYQLMLRDMQADRPYPWGGFPL